MTEQEKIQAWLDEPDDHISNDECDHCCSTDVAYPYTTQGYLCHCCREALQGPVENVE